VCHPYPTSSARPCRFCLFGDRLWQLGTPLGIPEHTAFLVKEKHGSPIIAVNLFVNIRLLAGGYGKIWFAVTALMLLGSRPVIGRTHPRHHLQSSPDTGYVFALASANRFLYRLANAR
jgi:hypothetical protein